MHVDVRGVQGGKKYGVHLERIGEVREKEAGKRRREEKARNGRMGKRKRGRMGMRRGKERKQERA